MNCFRKVLENVFHCLDLDGDRLLSRSEFELFHDTSSGEPLDDAMWRVIKGKCEMFISGYFIFIKNQNANRGTSRNFEFNAKIK